jgi:tryptophanase
MHPFHTIIEPFRIKSVETWKFTTRDERIAALAVARHNVFKIEAVIHVTKMKDQLRGYRMSEAPKVLRHFTAAFEPL